MDPSRRRLPGLAAVLGAAARDGGRRPRPDDPASVDPPRPRGRSRRRWPATSARSTWSWSRARTTRGGPAICSSSLAPFNSANYPHESRSLVPRRPAHAATRASGCTSSGSRSSCSARVVEPSDSTERVSLADVAPTIAELIGFDDLLDATARAARCRASRRPARPPKLVVTFVIDGGGWNVLARVPGRVAEPQAPDARGRELPQRDHGLVPRRHGVRARHDRHGHVPARRTASPGTTSATARPRARPTASPGTPTRRTSSCRRSPTCGTTTDGRRGSASSATRSGTSGCSGMVATIGPPTTCPVGVYWDEPGDDRDGSRTTRSCSGCRRRCPGWTCLAGTHGDLRGDPDWDPEFDPWRTRPLLRAADRPRTRATCSRRRFDTEPIGAGRGPSPALHQLQVPRLHRPRLRDVRRSGRACMLRRGRRRARTAGRPARRAVPRRVRADRHGRPRPVPAARHDGRRPARPDPARASCEQEFGGGLGTAVQ